MRIEDLTNAVAHRDEQLALLEARASELVEQVSDKDAQVLKVVRVVQLMLAQGKKMPAGAERLMPQAAGSSPAAPAAATKNPSTSPSGGAAGQATQQAAAAATAPVAGSEGDATSWMSPEVMGLMFFGVFKAAGSKSWDAVRSAWPEEQRDTVDAIGLGAGLITLAIAVKMHLHV